MKNEFLPVFRVVICSDSHIEGIGTPGYYRLKKAIDYSLSFASKDNSYSKIDNFFIAGDIINAPMQSLAKIIYGVLIGVLTMLFRYMGLAEHCVAISLFIVNLLCEFLDFVALKININKTRKKFSIKE